MYLFIFVFYKYTTMITFTSTLPDELFKELGEVAAKLSTPKNKLLENALRVYLEQIKRMEYIESYKKAFKDENMLSLAAEGMAEYLKQIQEDWKKEKFGGLILVLQKEASKVAEGLRL